jgi:hypothetical protein
MSLLDDGLQEGTVTESELAAMAVLKMLSVQQVGA